MITSTTDFSAHIRKVKIALTIMLIGTNAILVILIASHISTAAMASAPSSNSQTNTDLSNESSE